MVQEEVQEGKQEVLEVKDYQREVKEIFIIIIFSMKMIQSTQLRSLSSGLPKMALMALPWAPNGPYFKHKA